jgi:hypothetical protein
MELKAERLFVNVLEAASESFIDLVVCVKVQGEGNGLVVRSMVVGRCQA